MMFCNHAAEQAQTWLTAIGAMEKASAFDPKTQQLVCLGITAALEMRDVAAYHSLAARKAGADRKEIISAIMTALPAAGQGVLEVLPQALEAFDAY